MLERHNMDDAYYGAKVVPLSQTILPDINPC